ncbi:HI1506-related protein [Megalodesulfovibrio paquesii]
MPIVIIAKKDGFRRCGVSHSGQPTTWPDDRFTPEELAILQAEPQLVVQVVQVVPETEAKKAKG